MKKVLFIALFFASVSSYAQKIKLIEGDLSVLKDQKSLNTEFTYNNMAVGKFPVEAEYVESKTKEYNGKEAGRGDNWAKQWVADREERFEPQFRELFSKYSEMSTVDESAPYTLIFNTTRTEPGWNIAVQSRPASIDGEAWIVDTKDKSKVLAKIQLTKALGRDVFGVDFETGLRLQEAYAKAGKELGAFIKGKAK